MRSRIKIDGEFQSLMAAPSAEERELLVRSLKSEGCRDALVVWQSNEGEILLDGHQRYDICTRLDIPFEVVSKEFENRYEAILWTARNQCARRNLPLYERGKLVLKLKHFLGESARRQQGTRTDLPQNSAESFQPRDTMRELSKLADTSHDTLNKIEHIERDGTAEVKAAVSTGKISIAAASALVKADETTRAELLCRIEQGKDVTANDVKLWERHRLYNEVRRSEPEAEASSGYSETHYQLQREFGTAPGQLWYICGHRLLIADCTVAENATKLFCDEKASMVYTDPPYNINHCGRTKDALRIQNDHMTPEEFEAFLAQALAVAYEFTYQGAPAYIWHTDSGRVTFELTAKKAGWHHKKTIIWAKHTMSCGLGPYRNQTEPCLYCYKDNVPPPHWCGEHDRSTLWQANKSAANKLVPTPKPVSFCMDALEDNILSDEIVFDGFLGGGSTMEAAMRTGRRCYGMETDIYFAAVTLQRMRELGRVPHLMSE